MAYTDFPVSAAETVVVLRTVGGLDFVITCDLTDVTYDRTRAIAKTETFCAIQKSPQNPDIKLQFTGLGNFNASEANAVLDALMRSTAVGAYLYGPAGSASGAPMYSGEGFLTAYQIKATAGGNVGISGTIEVNGDDALVTWP